VRDVEIFSDSDYNKVRMRIEGTIPVFYYETSQIQGRNYIPAEPQKPVYEPALSAFSGLSGISLEISQEARAFNQTNQPEKSNPGLLKTEIKNTQEISEANKLEGCQTCRNRKYVDQSSDPSVSFQSPAHISPEQSASRVMSHEREHISNDQAKAKREDRKIISQTVSLTMSFCPECGKMYVSGGTARTVTGKNNSNEQDKQQEPQAAKST
jgi:ribosomal protein L32